METIICAVISAITTLIVSIGTWQVSVKKDREKAKEELKEELIKYHEKNRADIQGVRDDVTQMGASLQNKIALIELSLSHTREDIVTLSARVEKHNNFGERIMRLEDTDNLLDEKIKVANNRIADLERKEG